jgi:hypothetical protein
VAVAAEVDAGERREGDTVYYGINEGVVELDGVVVVLAEGLWWRGKARSELPTVSRRRRRTAIVGKGALVEI